MIVERNLPYGTPSTGTAAAMPAGVRLFVLIAAVLAGCAAPRFRVVAPSESWVRTEHRGTHVAYHHGGATIAANETCDGDDVPLAVLTNHLLFGVETVRERPRIALTVDGRAALRTQLDGKLDGVLVALDLVVLAKDGCAYDLLLVTPPNDRSAAADFERFVASFSTSDRR